MAPLSNFFVAFDLLAAALVSVVAFSVRKFEASNTQLFLFLPFPIFAFLPLPPQATRFLSTALKVDAVEAEEHIKYFKIYRWDPDSGKEVSKESPLGGGGGAPKTLLWSHS